MLVLETKVNDYIVKVTFKRGGYQVSKTIDGATTYVSTMDKKRAVELTNEFINNAKGN